MSQTQVNFFEWKTSIFKADLCLKQFYFSYQLDFGPGAQFDLFRNQIQVNFW